MNPVNYSGSEAISAPAYAEYLVRFFHAVNGGVQSGRDRGVGNQFTTLIVEGLVLQSFSGHLQNRKLTSTYVGTSSLIYTSRLILD